MKFFLIGKNVNKEKITFIELILTEALNNVIQHSYDSRTGNMIEISGDISENLLELKINDFGNPRENFIIKAPEFNAEDVNSLPESGMGLHVINELADSLHYESNQGKNIFTINVDLGKT
ncbi:MAG: ATP-binding protein [Melioribacteraceae bacterium]|nr:ATP-binding protein [Melioribacteraceae bacterium]MCF8430432.1 ATP-binding protein [Melioribacteraceae bacterium]